MNKTAFLTKMKNIYDHLFGFLESNDDFQIFKDYLISQKIQEKDNGLIEFLHLLSSVSYHRHQKPKYQEKIEQIILLLKDDIMQQLPNFSIFSIFQSNYLLLLFLLEEKIISIDINLYNAMKANDHQFMFFMPEITKYLGDKNNQPINQFPQTFYDNRKKGSNPSLICQLIRDDSIEEFKKHLNEKNISIKDTRITTSIFETNSYLYTHILTLIEYEAFF